MTTTSLIDRLKARSATQKLNKTPPMEKEVTAWSDTPMYYHQTEVQAKLSFVEAWQWWGGPVACIDKENGEFRPHVTAQQIEKYLIERHFMTEIGARHHAYPSSNNSEGCVWILWMSGAIKPHDDGGWVWALESEVNQLFNIHLAEESSRKNKELPAA